MSADRRVGGGPAAVAGGGPAEVEVPFEQWPAVRDERARQLRALRYVVHLMSALSLPMPWSIRPDGLAALGLIGDALLVFRADHSSALPVEHLGLLEQWHAHLGAQPTIAVRRTEGRRLAVWVAGSAEQPVRVELRADFDLADPAATEPDLRWVSSTWSEVRSLLGLPPLGGA